MSAALSHEQIQNFLHSITHGQPAETEALLIATPETTQELLRTAGNFTDNSGRTFNCTAYEYAHWARDVEMCLMLERYMDNETCSQIYSYLTVNHVKGLGYIQDGKEYHTTRVNFLPLIEALDKLDQKTTNIKISQQQYRNAADKRKETEQALEEAKNHTKTTQDKATEAQNKVEKTRLDASMNQGDLELMRRNAEKAQQDAEQAKLAEEKAQYDVESAVRNVELARLNVIQPPLDAKKAQREVEQEWLDLPAHISRDYHQQELRNIDEKNTHQLNELYNNLKIKKKDLFLELLEISNREEILLIDKILQDIPEDSLLYGLINHLKQKTRSLPSDIRDAIYVELFDLMINLNDPRMDKTTLIKVFIIHCQQLAARYVAENHITVNFDFDSDEKKNEPITKAMGELLGMAIFLTIFAVGSFLLLPPGANILFGIVFSLFAALSALPVLLTILAGIGTVISKTCEALVAFGSNKVNDTKANSISNAVGDVADDLSKSNHVTFSFFSNGARVVHDNIPELTSNPDNGFPEGALISSIA